LLKSISLYGGKHMTFDKNQRTNYGSVRKKITQKNTENVKSIDT
jgi:hypothetical protein